MPTFDKFPLSASVDGKHILITATASASATPIHTAPAITASFDEVWLYAYNDAVASVITTVLWGETGEPIGITRHPIASKSGRTLIIDGKLIRNGLTVSAYATTASVIVLDGYINRMSY